MPSSALKKKIEGEGFFTLADEDDRAVAVKFDSARDVAVQLGSGAADARQTALDLDAPPLFFFLITRHPPRSPLFPYTTLFRSPQQAPRSWAQRARRRPARRPRRAEPAG